MVTISEAKIPVLIGGNTMDKNEMQALFATSFPFWDKLTSEQQQYLASCSVSAKFSKGANIHDGNECTGVIFVKSGSLRLYMLSDDGKDITLYRLFPGEMCMLSASCAFQNLTFDVFVDAEENIQRRIFYAATSAFISAFDLLQFAAALSASFKHMFSP